MQSEENTALLLEQVKKGDESARDRLFRKFLPKLKKWARGRMPPSARNVHETDDLIQNTLLKAFHRIDQFEHRGEGAFLAYLRTILMNEIRSIAGKYKEIQQELDSSIADDRFPLQEYLNSLEVREKYESGLKKLPEEAQQAIILRLEFEYSFGEIAEILGKPSPDAARMFVTRAIQQLAKVMPN